MSHISLYRKWRPQTFDEVIGQKHVTNTLSNALQGGRLVHAYLFCGPRGTGKTSTARILAKAISCVEGPTATPCNVCEACVSISEGTALDVIEIDAASNRKIDEIRGLLDKIPYTPTVLRSKIYIIDEVHQLTPEASSALLKTLEEPPGHVVFVLATTEVHKILPTIVSRCQRFDFSLVATPEMSSLLGRIAGSESIDIEPEALGMIAEHAHGSVRDAIGVMDQIANLTGERVTQQDVAAMLGEVEAGLVFEMVDLIADKDTAGALALVGRMVESGKDPRRFVESLIAHTRSVFLIQNAANPREIVEATEEHYRRLEEQAGRLRRYEVVRLIERLGETHREMRWNENPRLALECALVKAARLDVDITIEGLVFRLEELERKLEDHGGQEAGVAGKAPTEAPGRSRPETAARPRAAREASAGPVPASEATEAGGPPVEKAGAVKKGRKEPKSEPAEEAGTGETDMGNLKRAWVAVLAELKKKGELRLYALLMKAKIEGMRGNELSIGLPEDAAFQVGALEESGGLGKVEEVCSKLLDRRVKIKLVTSKARKVRRRTPGPEATASTGEKGQADEKEAGTGGEPGEKEKAEPGRPAGNSRDLARMLSERFDGEIVEEKNAKE